MIDDDELGERLRGTFARVADSTPVPPPPVLPEEEPRRNWWAGSRPLVLGGLAAAAAVVVALVIGVAVLDEPREGVESSEGDPTPTTIDEAGRVTARGEDGGLTVTATIGPGPAPGLVAVEVEAHDGDGRVDDVVVTGPRLTPIEHQPEVCGDGGGAASDLRLGYTTGVTEAGEVDVTVVVGTVSCESDDRDEVALEVHLPTATRFEGVDGARTPLVSFTGPDSSGRIVVDADGVDGCLGEVLVDWGDPPARTLLDLPPLEQCDGSSAIDGVAAQHSYAPGERRLRVTATTEDGAVFQPAFMERTITV